MSEKDLIPIQTKEKAKELGKKGGSVVSLEKKYALLISASHKARCKNCKASCPFKKDNIEESKTHKCITPEARAAAIWYKKPVIDKEVLLKLTHEAIRDLIDLSKTEKYTGKLGTISLIHSRLLEQLKHEYPATQKTENIHSIEGNVDLADVFKEYLKEEKDARPRDSKASSEKSN